VNLTFGAAGGTRRLVKSEPPSGPERDEAEFDRGRLERVIPELVRRILEAGLEKISEGPESVRRAMGDLRLPRDVLHAMLSQLDETKSGLYRVVAKEVRDILEQTNFAEELVRALTAVSFEVRTSVRFVPNEDGARATPEVKSKVQVHRKNAPAPSPDTRAPEQRPDPPSPGANAPAAEKREDKS
jgi:hypothetical protein